MLSSLLTISPTECMEGIRVGDHMEQREDTKREADDDRLGREASTITGSTTIIIIVSFYLHSFT